MAGAKTKIILLIDLFVVAVLLTVIGEALLDQGEVQSSKRNQDQRESIGHNEFVKADLPGELKVVLEVEEPRIEQKVIDEQSAQKATETQLSILAGPGITQAPTPSLLSEISEKTNVSGSW